MGAIHALRVKSPYQLLKIEKIEIEIKPNEHGYLYLKCLIDDSINFQSTINASTDDKICIYEELEDKNLSGNESPNINVVNESKSKIIFNGTVQNIRTSNLNGIYHLEIQALTSSFELDIKEKSRSFQNANMTYDELIGKVLKDYSGHSFTQWVGEGQKIGKPLFQYKETDWSFLKRVASELNSQLFCDIIEPRNMFYFGTPVKASYKLEDMTHYKAFKNLEQFHKVGEINNGHDTDYFYYEIEKREKYDVGDRIYFKNKELYVKEFSAYGIDNEVVYKYKLCRKNGIWQTKIYNSLIGGASLEGKVVAVDGEKVKLHLKIDDNQSEGEAAWFSYAPPTGNVMYSMPIVGTEARLYFPSENGENPSIIGCVRTNGSSCAKTSDTTKRYFGTEHGSELEMTPGALNIKGGSKEPLNISIDDEIGVTITSPKKLTLAADDEIIMKTPKSVKLKAKSQILVAKENSQSGFSLENEMHFKSNNVIKNGSCRDTYGAFKDEPEAGQKPPAKEEKSGFNWGGLLMAAVAAVAVVAAVATFGIGAAIVGAVAVACIGAICSSSAVTAGGQSAMGALALNNFNGALCGADLGLFSKSWDSLKGIGYDIYDGLKNRADKALDSPYDFINWLTVGIPDIIKGAADAYVDRANKAFDSPYDFINCASLGIADMVNGAVNPEEPLSKEHWLNSFGLVSLMFGIKASKTGAGKAGLIEDVPKNKITKVAGGEVESILDEGAGNAKNVITEADRIKQFNLNSCREQMTNTLKNYRKELIHNKDAKDISKICSTADLGDLNLRGEAGSGVWKYNPTIKDYTGVDPRKFCKTTEDYTKYYRSLLSDEYLERLPDSFWGGKNKEFVKEDMAKLRTDIERVKSEAADKGKFNVYGEPSFKSDWNVDNCAEIWSSRDAILKGARYDDLVYRTENLSGGFAEPCKNCRKTFKGTYNIDY